MHDSILDIPIIVSDTIPPDTWYIATVPSILSLHDGTRVLLRGPNQEERADRDIRVWQALPWYTRLRHLLML